jgi:hypothetical protein
LIQPSGQPAPGIHQRTKSAHGQRPQIDPPETGGQRRISGAPNPLLHPEAFKEAIIVKEAAARQQFEQVFEEQQQLVDEKIAEAKNQLNKGASEAKELYEGAQRARRDTEQLRTKVVEFARIEREEVVNQQNRLQIVGRKLEVQATKQAQREIELKAESRQLAERSKFIEKSQKDLDDRQNAIVMKEASHESREKDFENRLETRENNLDKRLEAHNQNVAALQRDQTAHYQTKAQLDADQAAFTVRQSKFEEEKNLLQQDRTVLEGEKREFHNEKRQLNQDKSAWTTHVNDELEKRTTRIKEELQKHHKDTIELKERESKLRLEENDLRHQLSDLARRETDISDRETSMSVRQAETKHQQSELDRHQTELRRREADVASYEAEAERFQQRADELAALEKQLKDREKGLCHREDAVRQRELDVGSREENFRRTSQLSRPLEYRTSPSSSPSKAIQHVGANSPRRNVAGSTLPSVSEAVEPLPATPTPSGTQAHHRSSSTLQSSQLPAPDPPQQLPSKQSSKAGKQRVVEQFVPATIRDGPYADTEEPGASGAGFLSSMLTKASSLNPFSGPANPTTPGGSALRESSGHASDEDETFGSAQSRVSVTQVSKIPLPVSPGGTPSSLVPSASGSEAAKRGTGKVTPIERPESSKKAKTTLATMEECVDLPGFLVPAGVPFQCWPADATLPLDLDDVLSPDRRRALFEEIQSNKYIDQGGAGQVLQFIQTDAFALPIKKQGCMSCRLRLKKSERSNYCQMNLNNQYARVACRKCVQASRPCIVMGAEGLVLLPYPDQERQRYSRNQLGYWIGRTGVAMRNDVD